MTDDEIWQRTRQTYAKGVNDRLNSMIKKANFSPNVERLVRKSISIIDTDADGKISFTNSLTKKITFTDMNGNKVTKGYAEFMVDRYKRSKQPGHSSEITPANNKWQKGFRDFLNIADKHGDLDSRGPGSTGTSPT